MSEMTEDDEPSSPFAVNVYSEPNRFPGSIVVHATDEHSTVTVPLTPEATAHLEDNLFLVRHQVEPVAPVDLTPFTNTAAIAFANVRTVGHGVTYFGEDPKSAIITRVQPDRIVDLMFVTEDWDETAPDSKGFMLQFRYAIPWCGDHVLPDGSTDQACWSCAAEDML